MSTSTTIPDMDTTQDINAIEVNPEGIDAPEEPQYGINNRELPQQLKDAILSMVQKFQMRDAYDRRIEVLMDRMMRFYDDGIQHVYPNFGTGVYQIGSAGGYVDLGGGKQMECPEYMGAYNIFRSRRRSLHAVLTQNPPGIDFIPEKSGDPESEQSAEIAEGFREYFDSANDVKGIQEDVARMMELSGRSVIWTYREKNAQKYGYNAEGNPKQMETARVFGTLETRFPITCKHLEECMFAFIYIDKDVLLCKAENSWIRNKIVAGESGPGESEWERFARLGVRQSRKGYYQTAQAMAYLSTEMHVWFRPGAFEDSTCDREFTGELGTTLRDKFLELFPDGMHCVFIGKTYSESWNESIEDAIDVGFPDKRDGMTGGALMESMKVIQDAYNDYKNAERENYEKGWPATYFKGSAEDYDAIVDTRSAPGNFHLLKEDAYGKDATINGNIVFREAHFDVPSSFIEAQNDLRGTLSQDVTGALPALQGASGSSQTASGQAMDRAQAMGMLGPAWANMQRMFAGMYYKAAVLAADNPDHGKEVTIAKQDGSKVTLQLAKIRKGTFRAKADVDSSFPESTAAKRANLTQFLTLTMPTPLGQAFLESPDNWNEVVSLNGNPDIVLTPAMAYRKQNRELEILLGEPPIDNQAAVDAYNQQHAQDTIQAIAQGLPEPPYNPPPPQLPSLMPERDDFHQWESMKCREYLSSEDCWLRTTIGNSDEIAAAQQGIMNVRLHKAVHDMYLQMEGANLTPQVPQAPAKAPQGAVPGAPEASSQISSNTTPPGAPGGNTL